MNKFSCYSDLSNLEEDFIEWNKANPFGHEQTTTPYEKCIKFWGHLQGTHTQTTYNTNAIRECIKTQYSYSTNDYYFLCRYRHTDISDESRVQTPVDSDFYSEGGPHH